MSSLRATLNRPVDVAPLAAFRILFGALMAFEAFASYLHKIPHRYSDDLYHFTYPGFHWVAPPPGWGIHVLVIAMGLAAFCITLGYRYRIATAVFLVLYTWLFLIERTAYNNHYYLIILLAGLFVCTDAHADASVDSSRISVARRGWVPAWHRDVFRAQILLVYFFGGVAKLSPDWLARHPITHWLEGRAAVLAIGPVLELEIMPYLFAYGGLVFDLSIGFLLLWRRTRALAIVLVLGFHLTNAYMFSIGVFPWLGIGATVLFLEAHTVRRILLKLGYVQERAGDILRRNAVVGRSPLSLLLLVGLIAYFTVQVVLPFRHHVFPGDVNWTEEGHDFSWHMKLRDKEGMIRFRVQESDESNEEILEGAQLLEALTAKQIRTMSQRPVLAAQYARHLRQRYRESGWKDPEVYVENLVSLNGRDFVALINPQIDLAQVKNDQFRTATWLLPLSVDLEPGRYTVPPKFAPVP